jgi:hypothetical protein
VQIVESSRTRTADPYLDVDVVDERAPRTNQAFVAALGWIALATGAWWVAGLMGLQLLVGLLFGRRYCLPCVFYFSVIQPLLGEGAIEDARPPRFANIVGAIFLNGASFFYLVGLHGVAFALIGVVAVLATLAVATGFCMGCSMYRLVGRIRGVRPGHLDSVDLSDFGLETTDKVVIQFTHPLCSGCHELEAELRHKGASPVLVDVSKHPDLARKYHVDAVPLALSVSSEGRVLERIA